MPSTGYNLIRILLLRIAALAVFPMAAILLGILQRSPLSLALLAVAMALVTFYSLRGLLTVGAPVAFVSLRAMAGVALAMLIILVFVFVITIGVLALFRDTVLARSLGLVDLWVVAGAALIGLVANRASGRMAKTELALAQTRFTAAFRSARSPGAPDAGPDAGGDIIEGEVIDSGPFAEPPPDRRT